MYNVDIVVINFNQSSYEVMENTVIITIVLTQPSSAPFQITIDTVNGKSWLVLLYLPCLSFYINSWTGLYWRHEND